MKLDILLSDPNLPQMLKLPSFFLFLGLFISSSVGQSLDKSIPYPENELSFSAYFSDYYVNTYCINLQKVLTDEKEITRTSLYGIAWNVIGMPWAKQDGYKPTGQALDYYFLKLQSISYTHCELLKDHFHLIFDFPNAGNDTLVYQFRKMIDIFEGLENDANVSRFEHDHIDVESISKFQKVLSDYSPFLFFNIKLVTGRTYRVEYYYFNPGGPYSWPLDPKNHVMDITFTVHQDSINEFKLNTDFERFQWLFLHIKELKSMIDIEKPPGPPPPLIKD